MMLSRSGNSDSCVLFFVTFYTCFNLVLDQWLNPNVSLYYYFPACLGDDLDASALFDRSKKH